ncbi:MAG: F0F1 ATP synthase subunit A [Deltaproteobacteria bacterium]|jgi:F-type H+-transporting ATPase subunit a|nr:F0F1 ATP synthase subunit A [Deltaproteobacteria bacterium]
MVEGGLVHPLLLSTKLDLDEMVIFGESLEFKHVFYTWVAMGLLALIGLIVRGRLKMTPSGAQNVLEAVIGGLEDFIVVNMGEAGRGFVPVLCGLFLFILTMNLMGLVPGLDAATANINTTAAMALFVFIYYNAVGLFRWGPGYIKHFLGPMLPLAPLMLPLEIISHVARLLSLTLRLFGNIRGEELVLVIFFTLAPLFSTLPIYFLFGLAKSLQAFIFFMLTLIYLKGAVEHAH